ncbi:MAG: response regulator [Solimonas sp.]
MPWLLQRKRRKLLRKKLRRKSKFKARNLGAAPRGTAPVLFAASDGDAQSVAVCVGPAQNRPARRHSSPRNVLPADAGARHRAGSRKAMLDSEPLRMSSGGMCMQRTALVVDDSKSARFALRRYLESKSFKVDTADSAQQAYLALKQQKPDLIFLDHIMPDIDGFEALRRLKQDPATAAIPIVICSSNEGEAFVAEAREQGAADVLPKPPTSLHLLRVLESVERQNSADAIEQSLAAAFDEPAADAAAAAAGPVPHAAELADLHTGAQGLQQALPAAAAQLAELEARIAALERKIDQELAALRSQLSSHLDAMSQRVLGEVSDALLRALDRSSSAGTS